MPLGQKSSPGPTQTTTTAVDDPTRAFQEFIRAQATGGGFSGLGPGGVGLRDIQRTAQGLLTGGLDDPNFQNLLASTGAGFDQQRDQAVNRASDIAIQGGAFGGNRGDLLAAQGLQDVNRNEAETLARLRQSQFNTNIGRGLQFGFGASNAMNQFALGQQGNQLGLFGLGQSPTGQTTTFQQQQFNNPLTSALGGAFTGSRFGPLGALGGGILGGIFG